MMRQSRIKMAPRSLGGRLLQWVLLTLLITMAAITGVIFTYSKMAMTDEADNRYQGFMVMTNMKVDNVLSGVELASANNVNDLEDNLDRPEKINEILTEIVSNNPNIMGCCVGFEPDHFPQYGRWYEAYALKHEDATIEVSQIGSASHDYLNMEWFTIPFKTGKGHWTNPYIDEAGGKMPLFTYSQPIHDRQGRVVAVFGADVSLGWLKSQLRQIDDKNNAIQAHEFLPWKNDSIYSFIIGSDGSYIVHPDESRILSQSYFDHAISTPDTLDDHIVHEMIIGREGRVDMSIDGVRSFMFYAPVGNSGWSMAIVVPHRTFYHRANLVGGFILALMALGMLVAFLVTHTAIKRMTNPLARFAVSAREVAQGNFDTPLPEFNTNDEIGLLRDSFEEMQHSLTHYVEDLKRTTAAKASIDSELKIANAIQQSMLPKVYPPFPDRDDIDIYGTLLPAKAVGGDLYDYYLRDEKLFFCIGDVSGKGVPASLVMAVTRFLFRNISAHVDVPDGIVTALNEALVESNDSNMFVTLFVGVLDLTTGSLLYCNAGHGSPMLIGDGIGSLHCDTNIPLGLQAGWHFSRQEVQILLQTTIFLYTDGLTEAQDDACRQFGEPRILKVLRQLLDEQRHTPRTIIDTMLEQVNAFGHGAEQADDLTMLAVQYTRLQGLRYQQAISLENDVKQVPRLATFIDRACANAGIDDIEAMQMNLAIEEAVVNVMNYAYPAGASGKVRIEAQVSDDVLRFIISDSGIPFDPTKRAAVDTSESTSERTIGGLGIHLVRKMMDEVAYQRLGSRNVLTLIKRLESTSQPHTK